MPARKTEFPAGLLCDVLQASNLLYAATKKAHASAWHLTLRASCCQRCLRDLAVGFGLKGPLSRATCQHMVHAITAMPCQTCTPPAVKLALRSFTYCCANPVQEITLSEALCGCSFDVVHLDNRVLQVSLAFSSAALHVILHDRPMEEGCMYTGFFGSSETTLQ